MRVTAAKLRRWGGCCDQVDKFYLMWPNGAEVTRANVALAQAAGLDVLWTFYHLMDGAQVKAFISYTADQIVAWEARADAWDASDAWEATREAWKAAQDAQIAK